MSYIMVDYRCRCGEATESLEHRSDIALTVPCCVCGGDAVRVISAVKFKPQYGAVTTGKNGPPPDHALDTRPMADGVSMHKWREESRAKRRAVIRRYGE